jgi:hypothetical protein
LQQRADATLVVSTVHDILEAQVLRALSFAEGDLCALIATINDESLRYNVVQKAVFEQLVKGTEELALENFKEALKSLTAFVSARAACALDSATPSTAPRQRCASIGDLYNQAASIKPTFDAMLRFVADMAGGRVEAKTTDLKRLVRVGEKLTLECDAEELSEELSEKDSVPGITTILDICRGSILCDSVKGMTEAMRALVLLDPSLQASALPTLAYSPSEGSRNTAEETFESEVSDLHMGGFDADSTDFQSTPQTSFQSSSDSLDLQLASPDEHTAEFHQLQLAASPNADAHEEGVPLAPPPAAAMRPLAESGAPSAASSSLKLKAALLPPPLPPHPPPPRGGSHRLDVDVSVLQVDILRIKDRTGPPTFLGDCMINLRLKCDEQQHICEIQIVHKKLETTRKGLGGHASYSWVRSTQKLLELASKRKAFSNSSASP